MPDSREQGFVDLIWLLQMSHAEYLERFRGTAVRRAKHWMLQRNAAVALGNTGDASCLPHLRRAAADNPHPIVRNHAAWAIGRVGTRLHLPEAERILRDLNEHETDPSVREEIELALADLHGGPGDARAD